MPQSLSKNLIHLVYSTKGRYPWIGAAHRKGLYAYQAGIYAALGSPALVIGGMDDHVHALFSLSRNHPLKKVVEEVKKGSSKWMKASGPKIREFGWQAGYGAFSVSHSQSGKVGKYIREQEAHHRKKDFKTELRALLERHEITYDERYVWD